MLRTLLENYSSKLPYRDIVPSGNEGYIRRFLIKQSSTLDIYLHRYSGSDGDRWLHDHPWQYAFGLPLLGGYVEERLTCFDSDQGLRTHRRVVLPGHINVLHHRDFHRIIHVYPETWTLFIGYNRMKEWGFIREVHNGHLQLVYDQPYDVKTARSWTQPTK